MSNILSHYFYTVYLQLIDEDSVAFPDVCQLEQHVGIWCISTKLVRVTLLRAKYMLYIKAKTTADIAGFPTSRLSMPKRQPPPLGYVALFLVFLAA